MLRIEIILYKFICKFVWLVLDGNERYDYLFYLCRKMVVYFLINVLFNLN